MLVTLLNIPLLLFLFHFPSPIYLLLGMTNSHWYQLGLHNIFKCSWLPSTGFESHPDPPQPKVTGYIIPDIDAALKIVTEYVLCCLYSEVYIFEAIMKYLTHTYTLYTL